jgi:hypothetical protein
MLKIISSAHATNISLRNKIFISWDCSFQVLAKVGTQIFILVSKIHKFLGLFRNQKSANFLGASVRKSQIHKFVMINP